MLPTYTYDSKTNTVTIERRFARSIVVDKEDCKSAINNITKSKDIYTTPQEYSEHLELFQKALAYFPAEEEGLPKLKGTPYGPQSDGSFRCMDS